MTKEIEKCPPLAVPDEIQLPDYKRPGPGGIDLTFRGKRISLVTGQELPWWEQP